MISASILNLQRAIIHQNNANVTGIPLFYDSCFRTRVTGQKASPLFYWTPLNLTKATLTQHFSSPFPLLSSACRGSVECLVFKTSDSLLISILFRLRFLWYAVALHFDEIIFSSHKKYSVGVNDCM